MYNLGVCVCENKKKIKIIKFLDFFFMHKYWLSTSFLEVERPNQPYNNNNVYFYDFSILLE